MAAAAPVLSTTAHSGRVLFFCLGEGTEALGLVIVVVVDVLSVLKKRGRHRPRFAIRAIDWLRAVLRQIDAAHAICLVRSAAMEDEAVEGNDASRRHNQRITWVRSGVPDEVVRAVLLDVVDDRALRAAARMRQQ